MVVQSVENGVGLVVSENIDAGTANEFEKFWQLLIARERLQHVVHACLIFTWRAKAKKIVSERANELHPCVRNRREQKRLQPKEGRCDAGQSQAARPLPRAGGWRREHFERQDQNGSESEKEQHVPGVRA